MGYMMSRLTVNENYEFSNGERIIIIIIIINTTIYKAP